MNADGSPSHQPQASNRTGAHVFAAALARHGVDVIFGQSIPSALFLAAPHYGIRQIGYRTENAGAAMADAYARISNRIAVVTAQNGPAATLLVPGLAEALKSSIPIVAIVQDVHRLATDRNAFQELDHLDLFKGVAKWVRRVTEVDRIDDYVDMAFTAAGAGRPGPAVLIAPVDLFDALAGQAQHRRTSSLGCFPLDRFGANPALVKTAAEWIASARAPLVIAGGGVHVSGAAKALARLQDSASLPGATTAMGKGSVDETHPLSVGVVGYFMGPRGRTRELRPLVIDADVVLLVGNRTNQNGTDSWKLYPRDARYIHVDVDGQEIGRNYEAAIRLVGDARLTLEALTDCLSQTDLSRRTETRPELEQRITAAHAGWRKMLDTLVDHGKTPIRPERLMRDLDQILAPDDIVVADASYSSIWIANFLTSRTPGQRFLTPRGLAGLGWGLPFALGAKVARPHARVFGLVGDGGFAHVWSEMETARRMRLPVVLCVLNNQILGYQKHAEKVIFGDYTDVCDFQPVDHAAIARACGIEGVRVEDPDDFIPALVRALSKDTPAVIDVITDQRAYPPVTSFEGNDRLDY